jgi:carbonic anhydrase
MRLFEAIIDANHRALRGERDAGIRPADFPDELPVAAVTCIDPRLNPLMPSVLGLPEDQFIWLRSAGNIINDPMGSIMRSLSLACVVKGAKEITIVGHTDCLVAKLTTMQLIERLRGLGIERHLLPDNLNEYFGLFSSERQNVIKTVALVRHSPLIGPRIAVHGLLVDIATGGLEWLVNGYEELALASGGQNGTAVHGSNSLKPLPDFDIGEMKFPEAKIGEAVSCNDNWLSEKARQIGEQSLDNPSETKPAAPPKIPLPPPVRPRIRLSKASG